jgi:acetylornithine deacetylase
MPGTQATAAMLAKLVSFDTTSRNSNLALIEWTADLLRRHGAACEILKNPAGDKANLFATLGPAADGGIVLSGHTDVVPVDGQPWTTDPWNLVARDGRLYGRGTTDMKGFIAAALAKVPQWSAMRLARPIHFALSFDEEVGCTGVGGMIDWLAKSGIRPRAAIVGEPTEMKVVVKHKGGLVGTGTVRGLAGHSSQTHRTVNAVMVAAELIAEIARLAEAMKAARHDAAFDPPYSSVQVNFVQGGANGNVVPHECRFLWEHRALPGVDDEDFFRAMTGFAERVLVPRMRAVHPAAGIDFARIARIPGLREEPGNDAETLAKRLAGRNATEAVSFGTEAGFFQDIGIPTVVCGPGSILQAHTPDEYIALDQLAACDRFLDALARECAAP